MSGELVLVTGGSGFIGAHCIVALTRQGYRVRTTVRSAKRDADVRAMLAAAGSEARGIAAPNARGTAAPNADGGLSFVVADLTSDQGWSEAVAGCDFVLHVASPFPPGVPRNENELIVPARDGALRVLRAARDAGVRRMVLTSSFAAIAHRRGRDDGRLLTEEDWSDPDEPGIGAYPKSKTLAERAAWDFIEREGGSLELAVVNPVGVIGPVLGSDFSTSIQLVQRILDGAVPGLARLSFNLVDVRDVADLHLRAMTNPAATGQRFLAVSGAPMSMREVAEVLRARLGEAAARVPRRSIPDIVIRLGALFDPTLKLVVHDLGRVVSASSDKAVRLLGWKPRSNEESIVATAESLLRLGRSSRPAS